MEEILEAQSVTLSGCVNEACAVEFGKLLAAEQIILGTFSSIGGKFILSAKIIDVTTGENIRAVKAESESLSDITTAVEILAYNLAGLTVSAGPEVILTKQFGEIFITTEKRAIFNGVQRGKVTNP